VRLLPSTQDFLHRVGGQRGAANPEPRRGVAHRAHVSMAWRVLSTGQSREQHRLGERFRRVHQQQLAGVNTQRDVVEHPDTDGAASGNACRDFGACARHREESWFRHGRHDATVPPIACHPNAAGGIKTVRYAMRST